MWERPKYFSDEFPHSLREPLINIAFIEKDCAAPKLFTEVPLILLYYGYVVLVGRINVEGLRYLSSVQHVIL
jgi:hypothetical protein